MTGMAVVRPFALTTAQLIAANMPEADYAAWVGGGGGPTYVIGARVIVTSVHKIFESQAAGNQNKDPTDPANAAYWLEVSATNRWKAFDTSNSTQTAYPNAISYQVRLGVATTAQAVLNLTGANAVRRRVIDPVYGSVYDKTADLSALPPEVGWWSWTFGVRVAPTLNVATDLPFYPNADLYIDLTGTTDLAVGVVLFGQVRIIGEGIKYGARVGIQDYSRVQPNDYGDLLLVVRNYAKRANFDLQLKGSDVDATQDYFASLRAVPCLWMGTSLYASTIVYGIYKDFDINIEYPTYSACSLQLLGLT